MFWKRQTTDLDILIIDVYFKCTHFKDSIHVIVFIDFLELTNCIHLYILIIDIYFICIYFNTACKLFIAFYMFVQNVCNEINIIIK